MVTAELWIDGAKYLGRGTCNNTALDALNDKWQERCERDLNVDKRRVSQLAEHIRYVDG